MTDIIRPIRQYRRITLPGVNIGDKYLIQKSQDGSYTLLPVRYSVTVPEASATSAPRPHPLRCVTCEYSNDKAGGRCPAWANNKFIIEKIGCASHSAAPNEQAIREKVLEEPIGLNAADMILLAHDEWKRREERKHNYSEEPWVSGFINGFLTDKKWAREYVRKLRQQEREQR